LAREDIANPVAPIAKHAAHSFTTKPAPIV